MTATREEAMMKERTKWLAVVIYSIAMAWLESAVVYYLRKWSNRIDPYQPEPLPMIAGLGGVELMREAATLLMLLMVGLLAGKCRRSRLGYSAIAFGVWDIFYYVFLKLITGWPHSLTDWDILFLIPLPWWGPVLAPVLISMLMILWGTLASQRMNQHGYPLSPQLKAWGLNFAGMILALFVFMKDAISVVGRDARAVRLLLPERFEWSLFTLALALMSSPIIEYFSRRVREDKNRCDRR